MFFNTGAACQRLEPFNLAIDFGADVALQDQERAPP